MFSVRLAGPDDVDAFRVAARRLIAAHALPDQVSWHDDGAPDLFGVEPPPAEADLKVPAAFVTLAADVACHRDPARWPLLYEAVWRIARGERGLMDAVADPLVHRLDRMQAAIRRDTHRITAFLRLRRISAGPSERFVAWYEPDHRILRKAAPFFIDRFAQMRWSILTPDACLHWDTVALATSCGVPARDAPKPDALEVWWRAYYQATFNPARVNPDLLNRHMPRRFWRNLPETAKIPEMLAGRVDGLSAEPRCRDSAPSRSYTRTARESLPSSDP
jgi:uracil-DNA glycosylase